jgi:hypothetical protein
MKKMIFIVAAIITINVSAQNNTATNIIEGGKVIAELVRIFKTPKSSFVQPPLAITEKKDSCAVKSISDVSIKNSTDKPLLVSVYRRNGNLYEPGVISMKILPKNQETIYELKSGIYKIKYETENEADDKKTIREGEIKLMACINIFKEIKN